MVKRFLRGLSRVLSEERGATVVEYVVMLILIILVALATIAIVGQKVEQAYDKFIDGYEAVTS